MKHAICAMLTVAALAGLESATLAAQNPETVKGHIRSVNAAAQRVEITTDAGKDVMFQVGKQARLLREGKQVSLDALRKGMRVQVSYESPGRRKPCHHHDREPRQRGGRPQ